MTASDHTVAAWSEALDAVEASLRHVDLAVGAVGTDSPVDPGDAAASVWRWQAPEALGPIPAALLPRARAVLAAVESLHSRAAAAHATVGAELEATGGPASRTSRRRLPSADEPPSPRLVDHDA